MGQRIVNTKKKYMKLVRQKNGSILLLVLLITSTTLFFSLSSWNKLYYLIDLIEHRKLFYQRFYNTEIVFNEAVSLVKENFDQFVKKAILHSNPHSFIFTADFSKEIKDKKMQKIVAKILISKPILQSESKTIWIRVGLLNNDIVVATQNCFLSKNEEESTNKKESFVIRGFNFGNAL
jgi:hypothetical protein